MAIIKSAKKRIKIAARNRERNLAYLEKIKETKKKAAEAKTKPAREKALALAYKAIDKASKENVIHDNKADRLKSQLAKQKS